jgi:hypothetical protein
MTEYRALMTAQTVVAIDSEGARQWFLQLKDHPENYAFASHAGFIFTEGDFGEVGARFFTIERFHGFPLKLSFRLSAINATSFTFDLLKPLSNIKGEFSITQHENNTCTLTLTVSTGSNYTHRLLSIRPLYSAVQQQISREVNHIKTSMERGGSSQESLHIN